jgi:hypothetical protein
MSYRLKHEHKQKRFEKKILKTSFLHNVTFQATTLFFGREFGYRKIVRNFFETAHAKGPQDVAGGFLKNQADLAVVRGKTSIQSAKGIRTRCVSIYCFWYD